MDLRESVWMVKDDVWGSKGYDIVLASRSPRRRKLLAKMGIHFRVRVLRDIDESYPEGLPPTEVPEYIARKKAEAYVPTLKENELIITADTVVVQDNEVFGKPSNRDEALRMLHRLSGRTHEVITGVVLTTLQKQTSFSVTSSVEFVALDDTEIRYYVEFYLPFDKAGGYGIQEWIGYVGVQSIHGSYHNVMGLPAQRLYQELKHF